MNFEVFASLSLWEDRKRELIAKGCTVIGDFNGRSFTIKWKE